MVPAFDSSLTFDLDESGVQLLAEMEHERWMQERMDRGYEYGPAREGHFHPDLVPWDQLTPETRERTCRRSATSRPC